MVFDEWGEPTEQINDNFLSHVSPSNYDLLHVWGLQSPSPRPFSIWEDPPDQPSPSVGTPEPTNDMEEEKENLFVLVPANRNIQQLARDAEADEIAMARAQLGPLDAFGLPLNLRLGPGLHERPHRPNPRLTLDALIPNTTLRPANPGERPATPFVVQEGDEGVRDDFWTRDVFQPRPRRVPRRGNLFTRELRRRRRRRVVAQPSEDRAPVREDNDREPEGVPDTDMGHE